MGVCTVLGLYLVVRKIVLSDNDFLKISEAWGLRNNYFENTIKPKVMYISEVETKWIKFGNISNIVFVGRDTVALAGGVHVYFLNLNTKDERIETFDSKDKGEGASCLSGHPIVPMFAIAEKCSNPRILIFTYPGIRRISTCILKSRLSHYSSTSFAGTEFLLSLTSFPDFQLIIWQWRTGEKLSVINTKLIDDFQELRCSPIAPYLVSQFGKTTGKLLIYDIHVCSKIINLVPVDIETSDKKIVSTRWNHEGNLVSCTTTGGVLLFNFETKKQYIIHETRQQQNFQEQEQVPIAVPYQNGIIFVDFESSMTFYRKSTELHDTQWVATWTIKLDSHPVLMASHPSRDGILFFGNKGDLFEIVIPDDTVAKIDSKSNQGTNFNILTRFNFNDQYIIAIDQFDRLNVIEVSSGYVIGKIDLNDFGTVLEITSHPHLPIIALCTSSGMCLFVDISRPAEPDILTLFYLNKEALNKIKFSGTGDILAIANCFTGNTFFIGEKNDQRYDVLCHIEIGAQIVDFLIYTISEGWKILFLIRTKSCALIGDKILVYTIKSCRSSYEREDYVIELLNFFQSIHHGINNHLEIIGSPYLSKQLHVMEIQNDFRNLTLTRAISSGHQLRNIGLISDQFYIVTVGYDGLVIVRDGFGITKILTICKPYHRCDFGAKTATIAQNGEIIVCLGRNGNIVAMKIFHSHCESHQKRLTRTKIDLAQIQERMASLRTKIGEPNLETEKTWIELGELAKLKNDIEVSMPLKVSILKDFEKIKKQVADLLDANEIESEEARLPISAFDLDETERSLKIAKAQEDRERSRIKIETQILRQDEVAAYLKKHCWDTMSVHACALLSFRKGVQVNNYALPVITNEKNDIKIWQEFLLRLFTYYVDADLFSRRSNTARNSDSFDTETNNLNMKNFNSSIQANLSNKNYCSTETTESNIVPVDRTTAKEQDELECEKQLALIGTTSNRWIPSSKFYYTTMELRYHNCSIGNVEAVVVDNQKQNLKLHLNKLFDTMRSAKYEKILSISQRMERLCYCAKELKDMFGLNYPVYKIAETRWHHTEDPLTIISVENYEISEKPYVSPRTKAEQEAATREKDKTKIIQSDDYLFLNEALQVMMDGVLEVRWEDEIKKNIPKPDCLLHKNPDKYTEDDVACIKAYEEKVKTLEAEREKYKNYLAAEFEEIKASLANDVEKFDESLHGFFIETMKIRSAVLQESSKILQKCHRHLLLLCCLREISRVKTTELRPLLKEMEDLTEKLSILEEAMIDVKNRYENLCKREKLLEGKFRGEFNDLKQPMLEHLLRHYRRRPRAGQITCTSITHLTDVGKCVVTGDKSDILPKECLDFLKGLEILDVMPNNLPSQIDSSHWFVLCKLRRIKIEMEMKIKSCTVELAEAEQTFSSYQKHCQSIQTRITNVKDIIKKLKNDRSEILEDKEVQMVLKTGQVEVRLRGDPNDFQNTVLVPTVELLHVNEAILEAGREKLNFMNRSLEFRRTILYKEWRHCRMRMTVNDLRDELKVLESVKITKNIRKYLTSRVENTSYGAKNVETCESIMKSTKQRFQKILDKEKRRLEEIVNEIRKWELRNKKILDNIENSKSEHFRMELLARQDIYKKREKCTNDKFNAIMKKGRLLKNVHDNFAELISLKSQLESLKLKTYPTLRFKTYDNK